MCLHVLSAFACNRLSWITNVAHWRTPRWRSQCSSCGGLAVSARLKLSSTLTPPAIKKLVCCSQTSPASFVLFRLQLDDCVNSHGFVLDWRCHAGWNPHEQVKHVHIPFLSEHRFLLLLPVHGACFILPDEQVACCDSDIKANVQKSVTWSPCANSSYENNLAVADGSAAIASGPIRVEERLTLRQPQGPQGPEGTRKTSTI